MNNHWRILQNQTSFDLKCSKARWRMGLCPTTRGELTTLPQTP